MRLSFRLVVLLSAALSACSPKAYLRKEVLQSEKEFNNHIGFVLYDPAKHKTLFDHQGDRYFTPASNTKIFTFYTSLRLLGDSVPALRFVQLNDSLIFWGTGDPSFLYHHSANSPRVFNLLSQTRSRLFFSTSSFQTEHLGPGWAWDDYQDYYQVERTSLPIYGNLMRIRQTDSIHVEPKRFKNEIIPTPAANGDNSLKRELHSNRTMITHTGPSAQWEVPIRYSDDLLVQLLSDTLKRHVQLINRALPSQSTTVYSVPTDSLYKVMMQESDNFIAEQLLLLCANTVSDTLRTEIAIAYAKKNLLADLPDAPKWVDGSGLSRYNLFTPRSIVKLWEKIYAEVPRDRLFSLLATGGQNGTVKNYFKSEKPFIYGKTGSLSNNHCLSGYLVTRQGRLLIFSWMNNNFTTSTTAVRKRMETVLRKIYERY